MFRQQNKGQASVEFLIIMSIIFIMATLVLGKFFNVSDTTFSMILLKNHTLKELQKQNDFYFIEKIDDPEFFQNSEGKNSVNIKITINGFQNGELETEIKKAENTITEKTKFEEANVQVIFV